MRKAVSRPKGVTEATYGRLALSAGLSHHKRSQSAGKSFYNSSFGGHNQDPFDFQIPQ